MMKQMITLMLAILITPLYASINCIDNSEHLEKSHDHKEWHLVACNCPCEIIKGGYCTECGHRQNAHPLAMITSTKQQISSTTQSKLYYSNPKDSLKKLAARYVKNKYDI